MYIKNIQTYVQTDRPTFGIIEPLHYLKGVKCSGLDFSRLLLIRVSENVTLPSGWGSGPFGVLPRTIF